MQQVVHGYRNEDISNHVVHVITRKCAVELPPPSFSNVRSCTADREESPASKSRIGRFASPRLDVLIAKDGIQPTVCGSRALSDSLRKG